LRGRRPQIAAPLRDVVRDELRWYFERLRRADPTIGRPPISNDSKRAQQAFQAPRYAVLYRAWLHDGERALPLASSRTIGDALDAKTRRIEPRILPHTYGHLSPLVGVV